MLSNLKCVLMLVSTRLFQTQILYKIDNGASVGPYYFMDLGCHSVIEGLPIWVRPWVQSPALQKQTNNK
jgi:hypothetical protein